MPAAPTLALNERDMFIVTTALMNAAPLDDRSADALTEAIAAGRTRVQRLPAQVDGSGGFDTIADAIHMDGWRRRAVAMWPM